MLNAPRPVNPNSPRPNPATLSPVRRRRPTNYPSASMPASPSPPRTSRGCFVSGVGEILLLVVYFCTRRSASGPGMLCCSQKSLLLLLFTQTCGSADLAVEADPRFVGPISAAPVRHPSPVGGCTGRDVGCFPIAIAVPDSLVVPDSGPRHDAITTLPLPVHRLPTRRTGELLLQGHSPHSGGTCTDKIGL